MSIMGQHGTESPSRRRSPKQKEMKKRTNGGDRRQQASCSSGHREMAENTKSTSDVRKRSRSGEKTSRRRSENNISIPQRKVAEEKTSKERYEKVSKDTKKYQPIDEEGKKSRERSDVRASDSRRLSSRDRSSGRRSSDAARNSSRERSGSRRHTSKGKIREKRSSDATRSSSIGRSGSRDRRRSSAGMSRERSDRPQSSRERSKGERSGTGVSEHRRKSSRERSHSSSEISRSKEKNTQSRGRNIQRPDPLLLLPTLLPARKKHQNVISSKPSSCDSTRGHKDEANIDIEAQVCSSAKAESRKGKSERRQLARSTSLQPATNTKNDTVEKGISDTCNMLCSKDPTRVSRVYLCTDDRARGKEKEKDVSIEHGTAWGALCPSSHPHLSSNLNNNNNNGTGRRKLPSTERRPTNEKGADKSGRAKEGGLTIRKEDFSCMTFATIEEWGHGGGGGVKSSQKCSSANLDSTGSNEKIQPVPSVVCLFRRRERISIVEEASVSSDITFRPSSSLPLNEPRIRRCKSLEPALSSYPTQTQSNIPKNKPSDRYRRIKYVPKSEVHGT